MGEYVYVLADYDEHGLERRVATIDRVSVPALLERFVAGGFTEQHRAHATKALASLLRQPDDDLSKERAHALMEGWGGVQLYVIELA